MGGDVEQWLETPIEGPYYELRGGSFDGDVGGLVSVSYSGGIPTETGGAIGFRVAYVPEPNTAALLIAAVMTALFLFRHKSLVR